MDSCEPSCADIAKQCRASLGLSRGSTSFFLDVCSYVAKHSLPILKHCCFATTGVYAVASYAKQENNEHQRPQAQPCYTSLLSSPFASCNYWWGHIRQQGPATLDCPKATGMTWLPDPRRRLYVQQSLLQLQEATDSARHRPQHMYSPKIRVACPWVLLKTISTSSRRLRGALSCKPFTDGIATHCAMSQYTEGVVTIQITMKQGAGCRL